MREGGREGGREGWVKSENTFGKVGRYGSQNGGLDEADTMTREEGKE